MENSKKKIKKRKTQSAWINLLAIKLVQTPASLTGAFGDGKLDFRLEI